MKKKYSKKSFEDLASFLSVYWASIDRGDAPLFSVRLWLHILRAQRHYKVAASIESQWKEKKCPECHRGDMGYAMMRFFAGEKLARKSKPFFVCSMCAGEAIKKEWRAQETLAGVLEFIDHLSTLPRMPCVPLSNNLNPPRTVIQSPKGGSK